MRDVQELRGELMGPGGCGGAERSAATPRLHWNRGLAGIGAHTAGGCAAPSPTPVAREGARVMIAALTRPGFLGFAKLRILAMGRQRRRILEDRGS
jgi:hypothetical protein